VMVHKNILELACGVRFTSSKHWSKHPLVGISSFFFGIPACAFASVGLCVVSSASPLSAETQRRVQSYAVLTLLYLGAVVTSGLADFVYIREGKRSWFGKVDVTYAAMVFFYSIYDFGLRAPFWKVMFLTTMAILAFGFSGLSSSRQSWIFRHTLWHFIAGCIGTYGAVQHPPQGTDECSLLVPVVTVYILTVSVSLSIYYGLLPRELRTWMWQLGASRANWKSVA